MQSCAIAEKYKSFLDSEDGGWWVGTLVGPGVGRKYTNTRLMTLSQSTCFVTSEGDFSNGSLPKYTNTLSSRSIQMHYNFAATVANSQTHLLFLTLIINSTAWIRNCMDISFPKCWQQEGGGGCN